MLRRVTGVIVAVLVPLSLAAAARAQTFAVTRTDDPPPGDCLPGDCSLREALAASNASAGVKDVIRLPAATEPYAVELGELQITDGVEVAGAGADRVVIDAGGRSLLLHNDVSRDERVVLAGLTLSHGKGAIQNDGPMTLRGVSIEHNFREGAGGGIQSNDPLLIESSFVGFNGTGGISGGGIQSNDELTLLDSTVAGNESAGTSAIVGNEVTTLISTAVVSNTSSRSGEAGVGGSPLNLKDSILAENRNATGILNCGSGGARISLGGNVEDASTCALGGADRPNTDPGLGPLGLFGGTTPVHSLVGGGGAVDAASACPPFDQRGIPRPQGPACDSGPFELEQPGAAAAPAAKPLDATVSIGPIGKRLRLNRRGVGRLRLTCPAGEASPPCRGTLTLRTRAGVKFRKRLRRVLLAEAAFSLGAGESKQVLLRLAPAKLELLESVAGARQVVAVVSVADAAGNQALVQRQLRLMPAR